VIDESKIGGSDVVGLGSTVVVDFEGDEEQYKIVGAIEAKPSRGLISNESPIGRALIGKRPGQTAQVATPGGMATLKVLRIE
jgi:transcription elongation factor GreA